MKKKLEKIELYLINIFSALNRKNIIEVDDLKKVIYIYCNSSNNIEKEMAYRILTNINEETIISNDNNYNELLNIFINEHSNKVIGVN